MQVRWTEPVGEPVSVSLLQGNIPQNIKWTEEGLRTTLITYRDLAFASSARLIVMPETALPLFLHDVPVEYLAELAAHARHNRGDVLIGVPEREPSGDYYNSAVTVGTAPAQAYRKSHLVPFGEFIPLRPVLAWIVGVLAIPLQDFTPGTQTPQPLELASQRVAVNVCYEDAFGEEIIRQLPAATLLVNMRTTRTVTAANPRRACSKRSRTVSMSILRALRSSGIRCATCRRVRQSVQGRCSS